VTKDEILAVIEAADIRIPGGMGRVALDFYLDRPNQEIEHDDAVQAIVGGVWRLLNKNCKDPDREIRKLHELGILQKIRKGVYKLDPTAIKSRLNEEFSAETKLAAMKRDGFRRLGYVTDRKVLDSADYGVPQHRRRTYIVGFLNELVVGGFPMTWPKPSRKQRGVGQFVERGVRGHSISRHLQQVYIFKKDDGRPEIIDRKSVKPVKTLCASYHKIQRLTGTFVRDGETGLRLLTMSECRAIMGFPKWFEIPANVSRTQMYRQFGNSVAVPVVKRISRAMVNVLSEATQGRAVQGLDSDSGNPRRRSVA